jgi:Phosphate-selective porin O and P
MKWLAGTSCLAALLAFASPGPRLAAQQGRDSSYQAPSPSGGPTVKVGGYIQARETWQEAGNTLTGTLNRARAYVEGNLTAGFTYRIMAEYEAGGNASTAASVSLRDAYIRWTRNDFVVWAGQFKTPFSPEFIMSITQVETADRGTVVDTLAPKRDIGVMAAYALRPYVTLATGFFNGEGQNRVINVDSANMVVARATVRPIPFLTFGGNVARYTSDSTRWGFDAQLEYRGALVRAEYIWQDHHVSLPNDEGWYGLAAYRVLPWVQLVFRQEQFARDAISLDRREVATTGGVNVEFAAARVRLLANYVSRKIGEPGVRNSTVIGQAQVRF